jgi:hypothetical protein
MSDPDPHQPDDGDEVVDGDITITNEFTSVRVRKIRTRNGERLEIASLRVPHMVRLDALVLESLTWREFSELAKGLETPFGPGANPGGGEAPA